MWEANTQVTARRRSTTSTRVPDNEDDETMFRLQHGPRAQRDRGTLQDVMSMILVPFIITIPRHLHRRLTSIFFRVEARRDEQHDSTTIPALPSRATTIRGPMPNRATRRTNSSTGTRQPSPCYRYEQPTCDTDTHASMIRPASQAEQNRVP